MTCLKIVIDETDVFEMACANLAENYGDKTEIIGNSPCFSSKQLKQMKTSDGLANYCKSLEGLSIVF